MRFRQEDVDTAIQRVAIEIASAERRMTHLEIGHMQHDKRLDALEEAETQRNTAILSGLRGALVLLAGIVADIKLNGGALLKALFGG